MNVSFFSAQGLATGAFLMVVGITVLGALIAVGARNIFHNVLGLALSLIGVAGLYWTLGADFIGTTQILLYVGGVTVLILYAVMLTPKESTRVPWIRFVPAGVLTLAVGFLLVTAYGGVRLALSEFHASELGDPLPTAESIGRAFLEREAYLIPFELASVLLLIVVVGAVFIARRKREV